MNKQAHEIAKKTPAMALKAAIWTAPFKGAAKTVEAFYAYPI
jgi:hypothetical protein